jgi:hypothetical protein
MANEAKQIDEMVISGWISWILQELRLKPD